MPVRRHLRATHHCKTPRLAAIAVLSAAALLCLPFDSDATGPTAAPASADAWTAAPRLTPDDREFVDAAIVDHLGGVALGRLAQERGSAPISDYGRALEREHKAAIVRLVGLRPPASTPSRVAELDAEHKAMLDRLEGLEGEQFDRRFIELVQQKHRSDLQHLTLAADDDSSYSDHVRDVAAVLAPEARHHAQLTARLPTGERLASTPED